MVFGLNISYLIKQILHFGLDHQNNFFKLIYVLGEDGETVEVHKTDIESGIYDAITGEHFMTI